MRRELSSIRPPRGGISIHAPHTGCDVIGIPRYGHHDISIHAPHTGCDSQSEGASVFQVRISIHAPHTGCDAIGHCKLIEQCYFNPRTPYGMRRIRQERMVTARRFQSTHPIRDATFAGGGGASTGIISIHAPHTGCDPETEHYCEDVLFQSTHPIRDATTDRGGRRMTTAISIHAPHTGCDCSADSCPTGGRGISIHAPHTGCDGIRQERGSSRGYFNPRTPYGMRLDLRTGCCWFTSISIHAPHTGCDVVPRCTASPEIVFQSTHPIRDATSFSQSLSLPISGFQSTHPIRDATLIDLQQYGDQKISIHAPHTGCDDIKFRREELNDDFNPRTPYGMRLALQVLIFMVVLFQSTHPIRDATSGYLRRYVRT